LKPVRSAAIDEVTATKMVHVAEDEENVKPSLTMIIKADVLGSLEALLGMIEKLQKVPQVEVKILDKGLGDVTDSEVLAAEASKAVIYAFSVKPTGTAAELARDKGVQIMENSVIYKIFEDMVERLEKLMPEETVVTEVGKVEVLMNFKKLDNGWIIGGKVIEGSALKDSKLRLMRGDEIIGEAIMLKLQANKQDTSEVLKNQECGIQYKGKVKAESGDVFELYSEKLEKKVLEIEGVSKR